MPALAETRLANGLRVMTLDVTERDPDGPVVVRLRIPGGAALDGDRPGVARFTSTGRIRARTSTYSGVYQSGGAAG